jgi:hypothetical protein
MTTGSPALDSFIGALAAFVLTWLVAYTVRLFNAPVVLFHEQKDRADRLDGTMPAKKLTPVEKHIATLKERYLSAKPIERQALDNLVDGLQAIQDIAAIFVSLTTETEVLTKSSKNAGRNSIKAKDDFEKRRRVLTSFAGDLNYYSDRIEDFTTIVCHISPTLLDCTVKFLDATPLVSEQDYKSLDAFLIQIGGNVKSVNECIASMTDTVTIISASFKGISYDLNVATDRAISVLGKLAKAFEQYKNACEQIGILAEKKATDGKQEKSKSTV